MNYITYSIYIYMYMQMCVCVCVCVCILSLYKCLCTSPWNRGRIYSLLLCQTMWGNFKHFKQACHITGIRIGETFSWGTPSLAKMILAFMLASLWRQYCSWNSALHFSVLSSEEIICKCAYYLPSACSQDWLATINLLYTIWISAHNSSSPSDKTLHIL